MQSQRANSLPSHLTLLSPQCPLQSLSQKQEVENHQGLSLGWRSSGWPEAGAWEAEQGGMAAGSGMDMYSARVLSDKPGNMEKRPCQVCPDGLEHWGLA